MSRRRNGFVIIRKDAGIWWACDRNCARIGFEMPYSSDSQVEIALAALGLERASPTTRYGFIPMCFSFRTKAVRA